MAACSNAGMHGAMDWRPAAGGASAPMDMPVTEGPFDVSPAVDADPREDVVEVQLEAKPADIELSAGHVVHMWTYNGLFPGPRIEARVGDRLRVTLKNSLPEPTTIHWHGLRVPAAMDGVEAVQRPIRPGEQYTYDFVVPDAGTFWYHPHVRADEQVERGLYGPIVVRGADEPTTTSDHVVVLDDILLDAAFQIAPFDSSPMAAMLGREGNVLLANGRAHPAVEVAPGGLERFRFVNAANARYFRIALPGRQLVQIGSDGGLLERPELHDDLLLVPGQRADVLVAMPSDGEIMTVQTEPYARGHHTGGGRASPLFELRPTGVAVETPPVPATLGRVTLLGPASIQRELRFGETMMMGMGGMHHGATAQSAVGGMGPTFSFNGEVFPNVTPLSGKLGDLEEWSLVNSTMMDHPFHLHGFRFQVAGEAAWRDTVNVPAQRTVRIRLRLEEHPGTWMFHCHILEHAERGMMGELRVQP